MAQNIRSEAHRLTRNRVAAVLSRPGIRREWRSTSIVSTLPGIRIGRYFPLTVTMDDDMLIAHLFL